MLTNNSNFVIVLFAGDDRRMTLVSANNAGVAQLVEQLICNQQVGGSSPSTSSNFIWGNSRAAKGGRL